MTLSTWQLIVVAGLATVWAVVLGVPLLADLLRWMRNRKPAPAYHDPVPHDPALHDQAARLGLLGRIEHAWWRRPRPIRSWRAQDVARRRLQWMLACAMATTISMFLAIALRGLYVQLFLVMVAFSLVTLAIGAFVGAAEDENLVSQLRARRRAAADEAADSDSPGDLILPGLLGEAPLTQPDDVPTANPFAGPDGQILIPSLADITEAFRSPDRSGFMFEPLNLDEARSDVVIPEAVAEALSAADSIDVPVDPELAAELGLDIDRGRRSAEGPEPVGEGQDPRFSAAPEAGSRQASARARRAKRSKARPIYIESILDDDDNPTKVINE